MSILTPSSSISLKCGNVPFTFIGRSRAGEGTCFVIPELRWMFDCGALIQGGTKPPSLIFITHTHADHVLHLTKFCQDEAKRFQIWLPRQALPFVENYLTSFEEMVNGSIKSEVSESYQPFFYNLKAISPGQELSAKQSGKDYLVRIVQCSHRIDCVGFSIFERQKRLKEEFVGLKGAEIGRLRKEGVEITTTSLVPMICYLGDTTSEVFVRHPEILQQHHVIVVECSFIDEEDLPKAQKTTHMHWSQLQPFVVENPDVLFILTHFSLKYSSLKIRLFFRSIRNVHPMLVEKEVEDEWKGQQTDGRTSDGSQLDHPPSCNCFVCVSH